MTGATVTSPWNPACEPGTGTVTGMFCLGGFICGVPDFAAVLVSGLLPHKAGEPAEHARLRAILLFEPHARLSRRIGRRNRHFQILQPLLGLVGEHR